MARRRLIRTPEKQVGDCQLYVGNLPWSVGVAELKVMLSDAGVRKYRVEMPYAGWAFVYVPEGVAHFARSVLNGKDYEGSRMKVEFAVGYPQTSKFDFIQTLHEGRRVTTSGTRNINYSSRPPKRRTNS